MPSAKYCWSGSLLRLANGSTTIDRRGATRGCEIAAAGAAAPAVTVGLAVDHPALHLGGAAHRIDNAGKFGEQAVAGRLDDATMVLCDLRIDQLPPCRLQAFERALLVLAHEPRIARHIGGEDRGKSAG